MLKMSLNITHECLTHDLSRIVIRVVVFVFVRWKIAMKKKRIPRRHGKDHPVCTTPRTCHSGRAT